VNEREPRSVETRTLRIAYAEWGADSGWPVILSHGFPYDVHAFDDVAPILADAGARVIAPCSIATAMSSAWKPATLRCSRSKIAWPGGRRSRFRP